ncbi:unnamed protein product [Alopecurus aequalis]
MAGKKAGSMEAAKWMMSPCTAGKSEKRAVAGGVMQCPSSKSKSKRKAVAESSCHDGDSPPEGVCKKAEPESLDEAEIDKLLQDAILLKQRPGGLGPKLTRRLTKDEIRTIIALKPEPFSSADYLDELAEFESPEVIAEMRRQHEQDVAYFREVDAKGESFRQKVIEGIKENGYYEVDVENILRWEKTDLYAKKHFRSPFHFLSPEELRLHVATPEQEERWRRQGCSGQYVPDKEEELLINCGDDDDSDAE